MPGIRPSLPITGCRAFPRDAAGFTLMEILVVIVVIGVIVSAATLSVNILGRDRESQEEMERVWAVLQQAREEMELQGLDLGMFVSTRGYEFLRFDGRENRWMPMEGDRLFATRELPEGLRFRLWVESREIVMKRDGAVDRGDRDEDKKWPPQIMVLSSGDIMPFELQLERDSEPAKWRVEVLPDTDLRLEKREDTEPWQVVAQTKPPEDEKDKRDATKARR
ncbi:general secretion pathway protein H [Povalibacter uvarum]|uniref:Type II secretion system protein H n=1 Tax=Povalibacter uvarum TaxID=732238 RepID=A0A841HIV8_9GAMM|nr:type II secretion system minor pseudopilin GspH [Povalibacter uvarum]MBB6092092.1 general secretion pathway protein H [Povalibacter uvarum]